MEHPTPIMKELLNKFSDQKPFSVSRAMQRMRWGYNLTTTVIDNCRDDGLLSREVGGEIVEYRVVKPLSSIFT